MAGESFLGKNRMYASPAFHDVNGDGHLDAIIGDLPGRVTIALGTGSIPMSFGAEKPMQAADGKALDFNNW